MDKDGDFYNDTATTEIYTLSLHVALPISMDGERGTALGPVSLPGERIGVEPAALRGALASVRGAAAARLLRSDLDRKSTRLNSSDANNSYAVFCLNKNNRSS